MNLLLELEQLTSRAALIQLQTDLIELLPDDIDVALVPVKGSRVLKTPSSRGPMIICSFGAASVRFRDFEQNPLRELLQHKPNRLRQAIVVALMEPEVKAVGFVRKTFGNFFLELSATGPWITGSVVSSPDRIISPSALKKGSPVFEDLDDRAPLELLVRSAERLYARIRVSSPSGFKQAFEYVKTLDEPPERQVITKTFGE